MQIGFMGPSSIVGCVEAYLSKVSKNDNFPKDRALGGYLCIVRRDNCDPLLIVRIGDFSHEKTAKYFVFAREKAERLWKAAVSEGHLSSWQSRNEIAEQYAGAVVAGDFIFSFSGLPEKADEALMLYLLQSCGIARPEESPAEIAGKSSNEFFVQ